MVENKTLQVTVKSIDIRLGGRTPTNCALCIALERAVRQLDDPNQRDDILLGGIEVHASHVRLGDDLAILPHHVKDWLERYDCLFPPRPLTFLLPL